MNLLRSICCLFGSRCAPEEAKSAGDTMRAEQSVPADLGAWRSDALVAAQNTFLVGRGAADQAQLQPCKSAILLAYWFLGVTRG